MSKALEGVVVLDLTRILAGPFCTMMLADLGANVIKIEQIGVGDDTRQWGPPWAGDDDDALSAYFLSINRNKRSLTLDLKTSEGQDIIKKLVKSSHVLVENFKVGQMMQYGLDYETLRQLNPALVFCSITGYGQSGVYAERAGYDYAIQAMSGLMSITGEVDGSATKVGVAISDVLAGLFAGNAIQAALRHAEKTGEGQYIDIALLDTQIASLVNVASNYLVSQINPPRFGNQHPNIVPYQTFLASDGEFVLACGNDRQFRALCQLIHMPELANDIRYMTNPARVAHRESLIVLLSDVFKTRDKESLVRELLAMGIPSAPINDVATALTDENTQVRGLIQPVQLANGTTVDLIGSPLHLSKTPPSIRIAPPQLGADTDDILQEMGFSVEEIAQLRERGVV